MLRILWIKYYHKGKDNNEVKKHLHRAFKFIEKYIENVKVVTARIKEKSIMADVFINKDVYVNLKNLDVL